MEPKKYYQNPRIDLDVIYDLLSLDDNLTMIPHCKTFSCIHTQWKYNRFNNNSVQALREAHRGGIVRI